MNNRPSQQTRFARGNYPFFMIDVAARTAVEEFDRSPRDDVQAARWYQMREWFRKNAPLKIPTARQLLDGF